MMLYKSFYLFIIYNSLLPNQKLYKLTRFQFHMNENRLNLLIYFGVGVLVATLILSASTYLVNVDRDKKLSGEISEISEDIQDLESDVNNLDKKSDAILERLKTLEESVKNSSQSYDIDFDNIGSLLDLFFSNVPTD